MDVTTDVRIKDLTLASQSLADLFKPYKVVLSDSQTTGKNIYSLCLQMNWHC
jgi:hypothetical protein